MMTIRWRPLGLLLVGLLLVGWANLPGQVSNAEVHISRYMPGRVWQENEPLKKVEIFNSSYDQRADISNYLVINSRASMLIPEGTTVDPLETWTISTNPLETDMILGWENEKQIRRLASKFSELNDFLLLVDGQGNIRDALLISESPEEVNLPGEVRLPGERGAVKVPDLEDPIWIKMNTTPDPAMALIRIGGQWRISSPRSNLFPATSYQRVKARNGEEGVELGWETMFETDCFVHVLQRSQDGIIWEKVGQVPARNVNGPQEYSWLDRGQAGFSGKVYYRLYNRDKFGNEVTSAPVSVNLGSMENTFSYDILVSGSRSESQLTVRFSSQNADTVRISLLDEELRELEVLYNSPIEADREHLIRYERNLDLGKYYLVAGTGSRRYYEPFIIR